MSKWINVTDTFSEEQRHYNGTYMEICEVMDEAIEVSYFSPEDDREEGEIYVSYGIMYGISYVKDEDAETQRQRMKKEIEAEHAKNGKRPSDEFIDEFAAKYNLSIGNSLFNEDELLKTLLNLF